MQFGERLKELRKRRGIKQQEVADAIGVSLRAYAAYETKNIRPRKRETYDKLAKVLGCDVNELLVDDSVRLKANPMFFAGLGLLGLGTSLTGPIGAIAAAALTPVAFSIYKAMGDGETFEEWQTEQNRIALQSEKRVKQFSNAALGIILTQLGRRGVRCQVGDVQDLEAGHWVPDDYILVESPSVDEWWLVFFCEANRKNDQFFIHDMDRAYMLFNRFGPTVPNPRRKASIVTDDKEIFTELCSFKGRNSYRGNLSVILIDAEETEVIQEENISSFEFEDSELKLPIL